MFVIDKVKTYSLKTEPYMNYKFLYTIPRYLEKNCILSIFIMSILLFLRKPDSFLNPQFWAEDGFLFFKEAFYNPFSSIMNPYAGYLHLIPRLIASIGSMAPIKNIPFFYNFICFILYLIIGNYIFNERLNLKYKFLFIFSIILVPVSSEIYLTLSHIQWFTSLFLILIFLQNKPTKGIHSFSDFIILFLCGLTGPFIIIFIPLYWLKAIKEKSSHNYWIFFVSLLLALVQFYHIYHSKFLPDPSIINTTDNLIKLIGFRFFGALFFGKNLAYFFPSYILMILSIALIPLLILLSKFDKNKLYILLSFQYLIITITLATLFRFKNDIHLLIAIGNGDRYFFIPYILIYWSMFICFNDENATVNKIIIFLLVLTIFSFSQNYKSQKFIDYDWENQSKNIYSKNVKEIPINPKGMTIKFKT